MMIPSRISPIQATVIRPSACALPTADVYRAAPLN